MANGDGQKPRPLPQDRTAGSGLLGRIGQNKTARKYLAPAMTGLGLMSQLNADQGRDRQADRVEQGPSEGPVLLELPTRSYTQSEETDEMRERVRQQRMMQTQRAFTAPGGEGEAVTEAAPEEEVEAPEAEAGPAPVEAAQFAAMQQRSRQAEEEQQTITQKAQSVQQQIQSAKKVKQSLWRVMSGIQGIAAVKIVPLLTLVLQSNLQTINTHITHLPFIPDTGIPEDMRTGCLNGIFCCLLFLSCASFIVPFALVAAASSNIWETFFNVIAGVFRGLF